MQDEFDFEPPEINTEGPDVFLVKGQLPLERINRECNLDLFSPDVETLSGLMVSLVGRLLEVGDRVRLDGATAEVVEEEGGRANLVRLRVTDPGVRK